MSYKGSDVYRSGNTWSKVAEKLIFIQNGVCKYRYEKPDVHLQWPRVEESFYHRNTRGGSS